MSESRIQIPRNQIAAFCEKWNVRELALFGSVLRPDFGDESDVDVLVAFQKSAHLGLWEFSEMQEELENMFGRKVDLVARDGLKNPFRRKAIFESCEVVYAA